LIEHYFFSVSLWFSQSKLAIKYKSKKASGAGLHNFSEQSAGLDFATGRGGDVGDTTMRVWQLAMRVDSQELVDT
tara:strand:+ start:684 stop:908 length:225 start_codon:yes stop_codon:yes gene_type:complete